MKKIIWQLVFTVLPVLLLAQKDSIQKPDWRCIRESQPDYPDGNRALYEFIRNNLKYPNPEIAGTVYVSFDVETDGTLTNIRVLRGINADFDKEALRLVRLMPKWKPAFCERSRQAVKTAYTIPIRFRLE
jgi:periplasmic protein TonB